GDRWNGPRRAGRKAPGRQLRASRPHLHRLLLRLFPGDSAGARQGGKNQAAAELDFRIGAARGQAHRSAGAAASGREGLSAPAMAVARTSLALGVWLAAPAAPGLAQEHESPAPHMNKWSFAGPFGKDDRAQLQRGLKVYREVCQVCHGLKLVAFRTLADPGGPGFTIPQATAIAAEYQ